MNVIGDLMRAIDTFYYNIILSLAEVHWSLLRGLILMGHTIETINRWLIDDAFAPLIQQTNASLSVAVSFAFLIALIILGLTYMLAALVRLEVVNFRSAVTWYIAGALFFALGPTLFQGMNDFRTNIAQGFYLSTLQGLQDNLGATFSSLDQVQSTDLALGPLCDYLGVYLPGATGAGTIDGLDVALAYLRADGPDVMGFPYPMYSPGCPAHLLHPFTGNYISGVPQEWFFDGSYFDVTVSPYYFGDMTDEERAASIAMASSSHSRMLTAWPLVIFGVVEQMVYLLISIAMGLTFLSFSMAILFAFFKKTEVIAKSIIDQWIELIVQTVVIAMVQSLVVAFFLAGTAAGNGMVVLGVGLICLIFMLIVLWSGVKSGLEQPQPPLQFDGTGNGWSYDVTWYGSPCHSRCWCGSNGGSGQCWFRRNGRYDGFTKWCNPVTGSRYQFWRLTYPQRCSTHACLFARRSQYLSRRSCRAVHRRQHHPSGGKKCTPCQAEVACDRWSATMRYRTDRHPDHAEYDEDGHLLNRPMLVPVVGEGLGPPHCCHAARVILAP
ncbi:MAG: hypothetical protein Q9P01_00840 [Anaerolineae bacterium]|nr:hypothetical protein [Anaerolineae bacterium]